MAQCINLFQNNEFVLKTPITFFARKIGPVHVAKPALIAARWQAYGRQVAFTQNTGEFGIF